MTESDARAIVASLDRHYERTSTLDPAQLCAHIGRHTCDACDPQPPVMTAAQWRATLERTLLSGAVIR